MMEVRELPHVLARGSHRNGILDPDFPGSPSGRAPVLNGPTRAAYEAVFPWRSDIATATVASDQGRDYPEQIARGRT